MKHKHNGPCNHGLQQLFAEALKTRPRDKALAQLAKDAERDNTQKEDKS